MIELHGTKPGPACPAYHRQKNREHCQKTKCRYYQNHRVSPVTTGAASEATDVNESLDAISVKTPTIGFGGKEWFDVYEECEWHCTRYDLPSKYITLPWELE